MTNARKPTLCIDPQMQANNFIKKMGSIVKKENFLTLKHNDEKLSNEIE